MFWAFFARDMIEAVNNNEVTQPGRGVAFAGKREQMRESCCRARVVSSFTRNALRPVATNWLFKSS